MAINSVRTALQLLTGAGEVTRAKALEAAGTLLELPGVGGTSARAGQLAEELIEAATANQAMITDLVRTELDRRLIVLGLARGSDLEAAQRKIDTLEAEVAALRAGMAKAPAVTSDTPTAPRARASRASIRTTAAGPAPAGSGAVTKAATKAATKAPAKAAKTTAPRAAKKTAKKAPATGTKKAAAKKATVKQTGTQKSAATKAAKTGTTRAAKKVTAKTTTKKGAARAQ